MTSTQSSADGQPRDEVGLRAFVREIQSLRLGEERPVESLLTALEGAAEELLVADEELRAQQETIERLADSREHIRLHQERTMSVLPVPVVVTDTNGVMRAANAAAAHLVDMRVAHMIGKPLLALFGPEDRAELRPLIAQGARGPDGPLVRRTATLLPRAGQAVLVELTGSMELPGAGDGEISWVILSSSQLGEAARPIPETLAALASLASDGTELASILAAAATISARLLGPHVSISLGSPLEPVATASSSRLAQRCDGAQVTAGAGPSADAHGSGELISSSVTSDPRWPELGRHLPEGVEAAVATPVLSGERVVGTLTAYNPPRAAATEEVVGLVAVTLGGVLQELELHQQLQEVRSDMQRALESRSVIDQAKGVVMATRGVDATAAWQHLTRLGSSQHRKVRDIAEEIVRGVSGGRLSP